MKIRPNHKICHNMIFQSVPKVSPNADTICNYTFEKPEPGCDKLESSIPLQYQYIVLAKTILHLM